MESQAWQTKWSFGKAFATSRGLFVQTDIESKIDIAMYRGPLKYSRAFYRAMFVGSVAVHVKLCSFH